MDFTPNISWTEKASLKAWFFFSLCECICLHVYKFNELKNAHILDMLHWPYYRPYDGVFYCSFEYVLSSLWAQNLKHCHKTEMSILIYGSCIKMSENRNVHKSLEEVT